MILDKLTLDSLELEEPGLSPEPGPFRAAPSPPSRGRKRKRRSASRGVTPPPVMRDQATSIADLSSGYFCEPPTSTEGTQMSPNQSDYSDSRSEVSTHRSPTLPHPPWQSFVT